MNRTKLLLSGLLGAVLLLASSARAQDEVGHHEVSVQGTGFFTKDSQQNGTFQHATDTGGLLVSYRLHINAWLAAEASYGYDRNTQENFTPGSAFGIQTNVHQATGALVACTLVSVLATPIVDRLDLPFAAVAFSAVVSLMLGFFLFNAATGLIELVSIGPAAPAALLTSIVTSCVTAFLIIMAMTFGLILPRILFERVLPAPA